ncbi:hypothetical protein A200_07433 [Parascardovia denticolens IPLA 20019]|nr:hypothetical protein A200_07433 [Parascardovia denticolens IPLA 20019]
MRTKPWVFGPGFSISWGLLIGLIFAVGLLICFWADFMVGFPSDFSAESLADFLVDLRKMHKACILMSLCMMCI